MAHTPQALTFSSSGVSDAAERRASARQSGQLARVESDESFERAAARIRPSWESVPGTARQLAGALVNTAADALDERRAQPLLPAGSRTLPFSDVGSNTIRAKSPLASPLERGAIGFDSPSSLARPARFDASLAHPELRARRHQGSAHAARARSRQTKWVIVLALAATLAVWAVLTQQRQRNDDPAEQRAKAAANVSRAGSSQRADSATDRAETSLAEPPRALDATRKRQRTQPIVTKKPAPKKAVPPAKSTAPSVQRAASKPARAANAAQAAEPDRDLKPFQVGTGLLRDNPY